MAKPKLTVIEGTPKPKVPRKRKAPDEWRAMNRAYTVKDGRPVALAFANENDPDHFIIVPCYWHKATKEWWPLHTGPEVPDFDPAEALYGEPLSWRPMDTKIRCFDTTFACAEKKTNGNASKGASKNAHRKQDFSRHSNGFNGYAPGTSALL